MVKEELSREEMQAEALTGFFGEELKERLKGKGISILPCSDEADSLADAIYAKMEKLGMEKIVANSVGMPISGMLEAMSQADLVVIIASSHDRDGSGLQIGAAVKFVNSPDKYSTIVVSLDEKIDSRIRGAIGGVVAIDDKNAGTLFAKGIGATSKI